MCPLTHSRLPDKCNRDIAIEVAHSKVTADGMGQADAPGAMLPNGLDAYDLCHCVLTIQARQCSAA